MQPLPKIYKYDQNILKQLQRSPKTEDYQRSPEDRASDILYICGTTNFKLIYKILQNS